VTLQGFPVYESAVPEVIEILHLLEKYSSLIKKGTVANATVPNKILTKRTFI